MLGLCNRPLIVAPMGGGPSTPALVVAAAQAGALGFIAGGYQTAEDLHRQIADVRAATTGAFGVNVFVPGAPTTAPDALNAYLDELAADAEALGTELGPASWDDNHWHAKADLLLDTAPPIVSFTFGSPPPALITALQQRGSTVMVTATNLTEAQIATTAGTDVLCLQGIEAGAHRSTFTPDAGDHTLSTLDLVTTVSRVVNTPIVAAGGISLPDQVAHTLSHGAVAVQAGTAFLRCPESGAHPAHKAALIDPQFTTTAMTKSFSGRPARGLRNNFMRHHPHAPDAYPEINNATRPLRTAAARQGNVHAMSLWAGTGHRYARDLPASQIVEWLTTGVDSAD